MFFTKIINFIRESWVKLEREDKFIIFVLLFSFLIRIIHLFYSPVRGWDETIYMNLGHDLSLNPLFYSMQSGSWSDFIPSTELFYSWRNIGFRPPVLPYILALFYHLNIGFFVPLIVPFLATASVLLVYILGKNLFNNKNIGLYSAILFSLVPIHIYCSERIWTDAVVLFFVLLTIIFFWNGYEKNNKKYKILFGLFLAISILTRYTAMWMIPIFFLYFILKNKSLKFLKDKYLWYAIGIFFLVLTPWFIYGIVYYNNPLGGFIHGFKASTYYGGVQSWNYFIVNSWRIFSIVGVLFISSLFFITFKRLFFKREVYFLLIIAIFTSIMAMVMPHKEDRYILLSLPAISLISGFFINKIKNYKNIIFIIICMVLLWSLIIHFKT